MKSAGGFHIGTFEGRELIDRSGDHVAIVGPTGCVDADTEYLSPTGWRRIADYDGGMILQWDRETQIAAWEHPERYIRRPCQDFLRFKTKYGIDQMLTPDHRVLYRTSKGNLAVKTAEEVAAAHARTRRGFEGRFLTTFRSAGGEGLSLTDAQIRVQVAFIADGTQAWKDRGRVRVKRLRKIERMARLLREADLDFKRSADGDYSIFWFHPPRMEKVFSEWWWHATPPQLALIAEEVFHWDGSIDGSAFTSTQQASIDFVQYALASVGRRGSIHLDDRGDRKNPCFGIRFTDRAEVSMAVGDPGEKREIAMVPATDGLAYCFTVPSGFWVARRGGGIFITGNCGKDQSLIIKTMLDGWYGSTVSHDLKGELWATCAKRRSRFAHQLRFDLTDPFSVGINPLDWVEPEHRSGMSDLSPAVSQMQNIVGFLTEDGDKTHWTTAARGYMVGVGLHLLYAGRDEDKNIGGMRRFIARGDAGLFEMQGVAAHPICARAAGEMLTMGGKGKDGDEKEQSGYRGSVYNSAGALLNLWDDPVIDRVTSRSDFDVADLMCAESPCDLYLVNRPSDSERIRPVNKCVLVMVRRMLMHEELTAKGRVKNHRVGGIYNEVLELRSGDEAAVARAARSYGFKFLFAGQSLIEIEKEMGNGLLNNCATRVFFRPNDDREARRISEMIGDARVEVRHESRSYDHSGFFAKGRTVSPREEPRPVLPPDEIMRWPQRTHAVILGGGKPILSDVRMAYQQPHYANLMAPPPALRGEDGCYLDLPGGERKFASPWLGRRKKGPPRAVVNTAGGTAAKGAKRGRPAAAVVPHEAAAPARRVAI